MYLLALVFFIFLMYHLLNDDSPYVFENILKVSVDKKPFISLKEMKKQLEKIKKPEQIHELKRIIKNRKLFWVHFILFIVNFLVIALNSK